MTGERRHHAAADEVEHAPQGPQQAGDDGRIPALHEVAEAEGHAEHHHPDRGAAEVLLEAAQDERALHLFPQPAGDHRDRGEGQRAGGRGDERLEGIVGDVAQLGGDPGQDRERRRDDQERGGHEGESEQQLGSNRPPAHHHGDGMLAAGPHEHPYQRQDQRGVDQRQGDDVAEGEVARALGRPRSEQP